MLIAKTSIYSKSPGSGNYNISSIPDDKDNIFIIGGKGNNKETIQYNFIINEFSNYLFILSDNASFHLTIMLKLSHLIFGNFTLEDRLSFIKLYFK